MLLEKTSLLGDELRQRVTGLLAYLALDRLRRRFIRLEETARNSPRRERSVRMTEEEHTSFVVQHDPEDADEERRARESHEEPFDR